MAASGALRIATRASRLALWQTGHVAERLKTHHPGLDVEILTMTTEGDRNLATPLAAIGGKGLFLKELETALLARDADLAVHSMKDVPVDVPDGLVVPVMLARADPRDVLVSTGGRALEALPRGARIGTSSLRRRSQLLAARPDLDVRDLRGNVQTRLARLERGDFDAIVLAAAGLERLGLMDARCRVLDADVIVPAVGQGVIGVECRADDARARRLTAVLHDADTAACVRAERAMNARLEGGCQIPIGGHAQLASGMIRLTGLIAAVDGRRLVRQTASGPERDAERIGREVAEAMLAAGGDRILRSFYDV